MYTLSMPEVGCSGKPPVKKCCLGDRIAVLRCQYLAE